MPHHFDPRRIQEDIRRLDRRVSQISSGGGGDPGSHTHDYASSSHTHAAVTHTHDYAATTHTHPAGDATTLDGIDSTGFALADHTHAGGGGTLPTPANIQLWMDAANLTFTNLPLLGVEVGANLRTRRILDLTNATQFRLGGVLVTAAAIAAKVRIDYSTDGGTTWAALKDTAATTDPDMPLNGAVGVRTGTWTALVAAAKVECQIRAFAYNGDGVVDPVIAALYMQVK